MVHYSCMKTRDSEAERRTRIGSEPNPPGPNRWRRLVGEPARADRRDVERPPHDRSRKAEVVGNMVDAS
jgi:hypothetical protein